MATENPVMEHYEQDKEIVASPREDVEGTDQGQNKGENEGEWQTVPLGKVLIG